MKSIHSQTLTFQENKKNNKINLFSNINLLKE